MVLEGSWEFCKHKYRGKQKRIWSSCVDLPCLNCLSSSFPLQNEAEQKLEKLFEKGKRCIGWAKGSPKDKGRLFSCQIRIILGSLCLFLKYHLVSNPCRDKSWTGPACVVAHPCNPNAQRPKPGDQFQSCLGHTARSCLKKWNNWNQTNKKLERPSMRQLLALLVCGLWNKKYC
jgi:hypothetical protein